MATYQGNKVVWGSAIAATVGIVTASKLHIQNAELTLSGSDYRLKDATGETVGRGFYDDEYSLTLTVIPYDATTQTTAAANFNLPARGAAVTVTAPTSIEDAGTGEFASAKWIFIGGSKRIRNDGIAELTMNLNRHDGITPS